MSAVILILILIVLALIIFAIFQLKSLKLVCNRTKYCVSGFSDKLDTNKLVLEVQNKDQQKYINEIEKIAFSNDASLAKVSKIIGLSQKRNSH